MEFVEQKSLRKEKRCKKNIVESKSLLQAHYEKMEYFEKLQSEVLPKKQKQLLSGKCTKKEVDDLINKVEETEYHLDVAHIVSEFIELEAGTHLFQSSKEISKYNDKRNGLIGDYFTATNEPQFIKNPVSRYIDNESCNKCNTQMTETSEGYTCAECGLCDKSAYVTDIPSYNDSQEYEKKISIDYKRINYFTEWLNQITGRESSDIPEALKDAVILELKKEKITDMKKLNISLMKRLLKKCGYSKFYEHAPLIISLLNGIKPLQIPKSIEDRLKFMFKEIQIPWELCKPPNRHNFFSYPYILAQMCRILNIPEFLSYFTLLKSREKLYNQDVIWKKVVNFLINENSKGKIRKTYDIDWRFIPSV